MKRWLAVGLVAIVGWFTTLQYYTTQEAPLGQSLQTVADSLATWYKIIYAMIIIVAFGNILRNHAAKIRKLSRGWFYSIVTVIALLASSALGLYSTEDNSAFSWMFTNIYLPLDATMFSLLAFFMASAAYRAFRARNPEATLMLVTAIIVMIGRVPVGGKIIEQWPTAVTWIMSFPSMAAKRGIIIGIALGVIAMCLKIILGIERPYQSAGGSRS
ncbi:MAG: hypothetical protein ACREJQ_08945 [bacterium]